MAASIRSVVVTGASTGIGRACALHLDARGWRVFAGVRRAADGEALRAAASERLTPLQLDVTSAEDVAAAAATVDGACGANGLHGLVNNAGIAVGGPLEYLPMEQLRRQFDVIVLGLLAATQSFLPAIRRARGRIVNMGSVSGHLSMPFVGPYAASKHALEAISDSLRVELRPWGIAVVLLEPGVVKTPIWDKGCVDSEALLAGMTPEARERYGGVMVRTPEEIAKLERRGVPPEVIARCVEKALCTRRPRTRYVLGGQARAQLMLGRCLPDRLRDWVLVKMLKLD